MVSQISKSKNNQEVLQSRKALDYHPALVVKSLKNLRQEGTLYDGGNTKFLNLNSELNMLPTPLHTSLTRTRA